MPRTDRWAGLMLAVGASWWWAAPAYADNPIDGACLQPRIGQAVVQAIAAWSQNFPFARVIIGEEGGSGTVVNAGAIISSATVVVCRGAYHLERHRPDGSSYAVAITPVTFKVTDLGGGYQVTLEDLPLSLEGRSLTSRQLLGRITIDGRPYLDILNDNQRRIAARRVAP